MCTIKCTCESVASNRAEMKESVKKRKAKKNIDE